MKSLMSGLILLAAPVLAVGAVEIAASGVSIPFFDAAGKLTHKVIAQRATKAGAMQRLDEVEIEYFAGGDPAHVVQRVIARDAIWNERTEILEGSGSIVVETQENRLTGEGFQLALATSRLDVRRDFTMTNREIALTSERAVVDLVLQRDDDDAVKLRDVRRCEAFGNLRVKVQPTAIQKYDFEEAHSERAIYDGSTHTITVPQQTLLLKRGLQPGRTNQFTIKLDPATRPAAKLGR